MGEAPKVRLNVRMKISTTLLLVFLLSGLSFYYYQGEKPAHLAPGELGPARILEFGVGDSVSRLNLFNRSSGGKMGLVRLDSGWRLESPVSYPAEDFLAEGMVQALALSQRIRRFVSQGDAPDRDFGFDAPEIEIGIETKKSPARRTLLIGKASPLGLGLFARWQGEKEYFLIPG